MKPMNIDHNRGRFPTVQGTDSAPVPDAAPTAQPPPGFDSGLAPRPQASRAAQAGTSARPRVALPASGPSASSTRPALPFAAAGASPANSTVPAPKKRWLSENMSDLWKAATRRNEFEPSRLAYVGFTRSDITGAKFLARIVTLTEERDAPPLPTDKPDIKRHVIHIEGVADPVHVLRRDREDGSIADLRIAKSGADKDVRQATRQMEQTANRGAKQRARPRPTAAPKDVEAASAAKAAHHAAYVVWRKRKNEFGDLFATCQKQPGNKKLTGPTLLMRVHELTDKAVAQQTGVEGIQRFDIELPGVNGTIGVLRRLHDDGALADLHLAPPDAQLGHMLDSMSKEAKKSQTKLNPELPRAKKQQPAEVVRLEGLWQTLRQSLDGQSKAYLDHQRARNPSYQNSAQLFVRHLNDLCDKAPGVVVDEAHHITRHEVIPEGSDTPIVLLRRSDENGLAIMRHVGQDRTAQAEAVKSIVTQVRRQATVAKRPAAAAASEASRPAKRARVVDLPAADAPTYASKVQSARQLRQALALMVENKRNGQPVLLTGVEARTGVSESALRNWLDHDGGLRRSVNSLTKLAGYFEVRDDLHELFSALGQQESAEALPQAVSVGLLAKVLKARVENPLALTSQRLAELTGSNAGVLHRYIDARTGTLRSSDEWLRHMPGYDEHRDTLCDALRDLGHVERADGLPRPETPGERFLRSVQEDIYPLAAAAEAMRADPTLTASAAAQLVHEAPEMAEKVELFVGPGGVARTRAEIEAARPDLELDRLPGLDSLLRQLGPSGPGARMTKVLMPKQGPQVAKLFVVDAAGAAPSSGRPTLSNIYANSPGLVVGRRSYAAERPRQTLRWLSTVLKAEFPDATEIQCYFDPKKKVVWVSSNHEKVNALIEDFLSSGGLARIIDDSATDSHKSRVGRHRSKLGKMLVDPSRQSSDEARELLKAMSAGRFRVPVETFHLDGKAIDLHAERRIKEAVVRLTGKDLESKFLAGTMRPCGICAKDLGLPPTVRRGPFWLSRAAQAFYNVHEVVDANVAASIGSYASAGPGAKPSVNYNTDSDSEDEVVTAEALPKWESQGKRSASGVAPGGASSSGAGGLGAPRRTDPK